MAIRDIEPAHILQAIKIMDSDGGALAKELKYSDADQYRLYYKGKFYASKPVVGIAHGFTPKGRYLHSGLVDGGTSKATTAATVLSDRGFFVDAGLLHALWHLQTDSSSGRPAPYQYVVILWAVARARDGKQRLIPFQEARPELAQILKPFAIKKTAPDPVMPWIALHGMLWDLEMPNSPRVPTESEVKSLNLAAGLSEWMYENVAPISTPSVGANKSREKFLSAFVDVVRKKIGDEAGFAPLLQRLGFDFVPAFTTEDDSAEVADATAALETVVSPRRVLRRRFSAAENKAIEVRAVEMTRHHLETTLGYKTEDVGATSSYDVHATKGGEVLKVEVKGTTTGGEAIVLTYNEVELHKTECPNNALAIVRNIVLNRSGETPTATDGELELKRPWPIDMERLTPIAYRYDLS